jgi:hypothetical protein
MHLKVKTINLDHECVINWVEEKSGQFLLSVKSAHCTVSRDANKWSIFIFTGTSFK